jgi:hypothetical protein
VSNTEKTNIQAERSGGGVKESRMLSPCPICGSEKGYRLWPGSTYRWWAVQCWECGREIGECRTQNVTIVANRCIAADEVWQDASAYSAALKNRVTELEAKAVIPAPD